MNHGSDVASRANGSQPNRAIGLFEVPGRDLRRLKLNRVKHGRIWI